MPAPLQQAVAGVTCGQGRLLAPGLLPVQGLILSTVIHFKYTIPGPAS